MNPRSSGPPRLPAGAALRAGRVGCGRWWCVVGLEQARGGSGNGQLEVGSVEGGLNVLLEACERAVEGIGSSVPSVQLRALLIIDGAGALSLNQLARGLGASASASSRLCDRMAAAGLVSRARAWGGRRGIVLGATEVGGGL